MTVPPAGLNKQHEEEGVIIKIEPSTALTTNPSPHALKTKHIKYCSLALKVLGLLIIVGIVLLFALLPNLLRNNTTESYKESASDPTNARLPGGGA